MKKGTSLGKKLVHDEVLTSSGPNWVIREEQWIRQTSIRAMPSSTRLRVKIGEVADWAKEWGQKVINYKISGATNEGMLMECSYRDVGVTRPRQIDVLLRNSSFEMTYSWVVVARFDANGYETNSYQSYLISRKTNVETIREYHIRTDNENRGITHTRVNFEWLQRAMWAFVLEWLIFIQENMPISTVFHNAQSGLESCCLMRSRGKRNQPLIKTLLFETLEGILQFGEIECGQ